MHETMGLLHRVSARLMLVHSCPCLWLRGLPICVVLLLHDGVLTGSRRQLHVSGPQAPAKLQELQRISLSLESVCDDAKSLGRMCAQQGPRSLRHRDGNPCPSPAVPGWQRRCDPKCPMLTEQRDRRHPDVRGLHRERYASVHLRGRL